jgi:hypothetical protein
VALDPPPTAVPDSEQDFVDHALHDPWFGAKNAYILNRCWGYPVASPPCPSWTPPPPVLGPPAPRPPNDPALEAKALTFEAMEKAARKSGRPVMLSLPGMPDAVAILGATPEELEHVRHALESIPTHARGFMRDIKCISVASCEAFRGEDGGLSTDTTGCYDAERLVLNRWQLNRHQRVVAADAPDPVRAEARRQDAEDWFNCITHELCHVCDHHLHNPSEATDSPMGHGTWYTHYAWTTQLKPEDMAEGYALLCRQRWDVMHHHVTP